MTGRELLLIPGPVSVEDDVRAAYGREVVPHYGEAWVGLYRRVAAKLGQVMGTAADVVVPFAPGTAAIEMALVSTLARGDRVLVPATGTFAGRIAALARACGLDVVEVAADPLRPVDPADVEAALRRDPLVRAVAVVHHETGLGLVNPVREICCAASELDRLTLVDAVSSLGGIPLEVDAWTIDLCVGVANKCLGGQVGIAPVSVSSRAWQAADDGRDKAAGWYLNLATWRTFARDWGDWHPHPTTMPTAPVEALDVALDQLLAEGLGAFQARHAAVARRVREGLRELGLDPLVDDADASPVTTAARARPGMDVRHYLRWLGAEHGLRVAPATGPLAETAFRVGHMGRAARVEVADAYLEATRRYLKEHRGR